MNRQPDEKWLDELIARSFDSKEPHFDLEQWKQKYPDEFQMLRARSQPGFSPSDIPRRRVLRTIFTRKLTRLASAAALIMVLGIVLYLVNNSRSGAVWADVIDHIQATQTVSYKVTYQRQHQPEQSARVMYDTPYFLREESLTDGKVEIWNYSQRKRLILLPQKKLAVVYEYVNRQDNLDSLPKDIQRLFGRHLWELFREDYEYFGEFSGNEQINGRLAHIFVARGQDKKIVVGTDPLTSEPVPIRKEIKVWIDSQTKLPVRAEIFIKKVRSGGENFIFLSPFYKYVLSEFVWNKPIEGLLFSTEVPAGYGVSEHKINVYPPSEMTLVEALADCAELAGGVFPDGFDERNLVKILNEIMSESRGKKLIREEKILIYQKIQIITAAARFISGFKAANDWHYTGRGVKMGEADTPVCWWKPDGAGTYRVIYADLTVADLTIHELPEIVELRENN